MFEILCFTLTDLRWQLGDGVFGDLEHGELGEQSQVVRQPADLCPSDVPLFQVGHPLQLPGEVLHKNSLITSYLPTDEHCEMCNSPLNLSAYHPTFSIQLEDQLLRIILNLVSVILLVFLILLLCF